LRRRKFHGAVAFVGIVPLVGVGLILVGLVLGARDLGFLRRGRVGWARVLGKSPTSMRINGRRVVRVELELELPGGGKHRLVASTHRHEYVGDEPREQVLYDPDRPDRGVVVDAIRRVQVMDDGTLAPRVPASVYLIAPTIVVAGYVVVAAFFL
jgi:hypothetical protein